jgi:succinate dehydrogenase / fumarate reductase cytochrome b subunit
VARTARRPVETKVGATRVVYKGKSGQWAFVGHRVSGMLVFFFLLLHIVDVSLINADPVLYDEVHDLYGNILLRLFEVGLLFALLFHSLNGIRIVLVDFFPGMVRNERRLFAVVMALTLLVGVPCGYVILEPFIDGRIL